MRRDRLSEVPQLNIYPGGFGLLRVVAPLCSLFRLCVGLKYWVADYKRRAKVILCSMVMSQIKLQPNALYKQAQTHRHTHLHITVFFFFTRLLPELF